jgi:hypothetical protein
MHSLISKKIQSKKKELKTENKPDKVACCYCCHFSLAFNGSFSFVVCFLEFKIVCEKTNERSIKKARMLFAPGICKDYYTIFYLKK